MNKVKVLLLLLIAALQYRLWFGDGNVLEFQRMNDRIAALRQEGTKRRERNAALEAEVMDLKQGLDAVEERARQDMDMIKDGEVFVQVIDPQHEDEAPPAPAKAAQPAAKPEPAKPKESKPREAAKPHSAEPTKPVKPNKPVPPKPEKPQTPPKPAAKPATAKPAAPAKPKQAPEPLFDEPIEPRPSDEPD